MTKTINLSKILWSPVFRILAFWAIVIASIMMADRFVDQFTLATVPDIFRATAEDGLLGADKIIEGSNVVYSLALTIIFLGGALLVAFFLQHCIAIALSTWNARRVLNVKGGEIAFAQNYEAQIKPRLINHPLVGAAWKEFDDTLLKDKVDQGGPLENTVRAQSFFNIALIRDRLPGLKVISSISGYFVGVGLLLTFIGIVLALYKASAAVGSNDAKKMQDAVSELLQVASFKFWTSIAGLATSICFALLARWFVIWIEASLSRFCEAVEHQLKYSSPNYIAAESLKVSQDQRDQLKEINSDRYFSKLADNVAPLIEQAMARAMSPVTTSISSAVEQLKATSQTGLADMTKDFAAALHGGAGTEMRGLQESLREIQSSLVKTHESMRGGGEDFARRLSEAAENLNRVVADAGSRLEGSADQSRQALADVMSSFKQTLDAANSRIDAELGSAAAGASGRIEEAMGRVLERLETQVGGLVESLGEFRTRAATSAQETQEQLQQAQTGMATALAAASNETAVVLKATITEALTRISAEIDRFQAAMNRGGEALAHQANAIGDATTKTRTISDAFSETAQQIRVAAAPLIESSDRIARAASELNASVGLTATTMEAANTRSGELAQSLTNQVEGLKTLWEGYREQFDKVDEELARALQTLSDATVAQAEKLNGFVRDTDDGLAKAVNTLASTVADIRNNTDDLNDSIAELAKHGRRFAVDAGAQ
ncbi:hypothetical protein EN802_14110 [bacterium M00.F.Ca.ET.159.01.1.1]|nr:hypothetical protein EN802_14110 [bacterium M00.F.Ca.ET.159.01.1.1]